MDIRERCDAPASRLAPNAERLAVALRGGRGDRIPNCAGLQSLDRGRHPGGELLRHGGNGRPERLTTPSLGYLPRGEIPP